MKDISSYVRVNRISPEREHCFFGYYDMSPESSDGKRVLINKSQFNDHMPSKEDTLELGYVEKNNGNYHKIGSTTAWNFQEGCRLQWMDNSKVVFNIRDGAKYKATLYDIDLEKEVRVYELPVYSLSSDGANALSYNFNRNRYCYAHDKDDELTDYKNDGIYLIDMLTGECKLIISLQKLAEENNALEYDNWVEHTVFSPDGQHFFFHHRWNDGNGAMQTNFYVSNLNGNLVKLISKGFCSHAGWKDNTTITAWGRIPRGINKAQSVQSPLFRKMLRIAVKIYHALVKSDKARQKLTNDSYVFFNAITGENNKLENPDFVSDGHCTWNDSGNLMLTDTYPTSENKRKLMIYSEDEKETYLLGEFYSYPEIWDKEKYALAGIRCDLHPKWSYDHKTIYIDSTHDGYRGLYSVTIEKDGLVL